MRRRESELRRETVRRTTTMGIALGRVVRDARRGRRLTQAALADRIQVSQSAISRIERGLVASVRVDTLVALGVALGRPLAITLSRPLGEPREPADAGHLRIQEHILALARRLGRHSTFELPTRPTDPTRSTDVGLRHAPTRTRIHVECWNTIGDLGAATRATTRKLHEARATWPDDTVITVWVVAATARNREILRRYPHILASAFPGSSRRWVQALTQGAPPPPDPGLVWFDHATGAIREHRRATMRP